MKRSIYLLLLDASDLPYRAPVHKPPGSRVRNGRNAPDLYRGSSASRGYDHIWRRLRLVVLAEEPICRFCYSRGIITAATEVDHILTISDHPELRLVRSNLRALCKPCHDSHTAAQVAAGHVAREGGRGSL